MKNNYKGFRGWLNYIRDYKDNIDNDLVSEQRLIDANKEIEQLHSKIEMQEYLYKEQCELVNKLDARIKNLNEKLSVTKKKEHDYLISLDDLEQCYAESTGKVEEKNKIIKQLNMKYAQSQRKIKKLNNDIFDLKTKIIQQDHKINFLKSSRHAPTKEEIEAYELQMKEVEKRIKNK